MKKENPKHSQSHLKQKLFEDCQEINEKIGEGAHGTIFKGMTKADQKTVAIKMAKSGAKTNDQLETEVRVMKILQNTDSVPKILWDGYNSNKQRILNTCKTLSLKTIVMLGQKLISILESLHSLNVLHLDIKPDNIMLSEDWPNDPRIWLIDQGLSQIVKNYDSKLKKINTFVGTTRQASRNAHWGLTLSRRDDLESLGYLLVFLFNGILPWMSVSYSNWERKLMMVGKMKMSIDNETLCKGLPSEFIGIFDYIKKLKFNQKPNYQQLLDLLLKIAQKSNFIIDQAWDWILDKELSLKIQNKLKKKNMKIVEKTDLKKGDFEDCDYISEEKENIVKNLMTEFQEKCQTVKKVPHNLQSPDTFQNRIKISQRQNKRNSSLSYFPAKPWFEVPTLETCEKYQTSKISPSLKSSNSGKDDLNNSIIGRISQINFAFDETSVLPDELKEICSNNVKNQIENLHLQNKEKYQLIYKVIKNFHQGSSTFKKDDLLI